MTFAKLEQGTIRHCPSRGRDGVGRYHTDLPRYYETAADREGWLELVETAPPEGDYRAVYTETDGRILQSWEPVTVPPEPTLEERVDLLEEAVLEMSETVYA